MAHGPRRSVIVATHGRALLGKDRARRRSLFESRSDPLASGKTGARRLRFDAHEDEVICARARDQSDYIIRRDGARVTVAGIRSTGLTASLAIGERALALVEEVLPRCAVPTPQGFALPSLDELRASYEGDASAGDGGDC